MTETDGSTTEDDGRASHSGLLGCLLQAARAMNRCTIAMGTSFSCIHVVQSGGDHFNCTQPPRAASAVHGSRCRVAASAGDCAEDIKFYADLLDVDVELDLISSAACANSCKVCNDVLYCCTGQP